MGHKQKDKPQSTRFNNVFKDTRNYKRSKDEATFYGNWMNQTKRCLQDFPNINFTRVTPEGWFTPKDLTFNKNIEHLNIQQFLDKFKLSVK
jgi:hypothetical protein